MNKTKYRNRTTLRVLLNLLPDPAAIVDGKGNFLTVNNAFQERTGVSRKELVGTPILKLNIFTPESKAVFLENLKKRLRGTPVEPYEVCFTGKAGETKCAEVVRKKIQYAGKIVDLFVLHDITDRKKKAEEQIRASEEKYKNLFENAPDVIVTINLNGKITSVNKAIMLHGFKENEIVGNSIFKLVPIEYNQKLLNGLKNIAAGNPAQGEIEIVTPNGKRSAEYNSNLIWLNGKVVGYQTMLRDVTERQKAEEALRESKEKYRKLFEESMDAIFVADAATGIIVDCNHAALKLVGRQKSELVGQHQSIVFPQEQIDRGFSRSFKQHLKNPTKTLETQVMRKTGEIRDVAVKATVFKLKGKQLMQGTFRDISEKKQAGQKLQEAEERYHALFNEAPLGVLVIDPETAKPIEFNDIAHTQLGYSREEFSKLCISDFEAKEKADEMKAHLAKIVREGGDEFETKHRTKNSETRDVLVTATVVELGGKPFLCCIYHDITEIKKVQDALVQSEAQYRQLVNIAQEGIWALDCSYDTLFVNPRMAQMLGYAESEMIGKSLFDFLDPQTVKKAKRNLGQRQQGKVEHLEYEFPRKDGTRIYTSISTSQITNDDGKHVGTLALLSDITERKKAEIYLKNSEEKFRNLAEQSPNIIYINQKGKVVYANTEAEKSTGYKKAEFYSPEFNFIDLIAPESKELVKSRFIKHVKGEDVRPYEYKLISKKGQTIDVINNSKVIDYNGEPAILGIETDITESKKLKEKLEQYSMHLEGLVKERTVQLEQAQAQLVKSERLAAIGELAGMVGHDLRNPLTSIKNAAYYLNKKEGICTEGQAKAMLKIIDEAIDHSNKIINDLLNYSREIHLELTECAPHRLVEVAVRIIQVPDRIQIINKILEETWIRVDADKMLRVFTNLIKNAIDAMPQKGTLEIRSHKTSDNIEITFADTGLGIPEETLPKLFSPLFTTKAQGMGFGLAICKRVVESHGGTIKVKTAVNRGTTFAMTLPIKPELEVGGAKTRINVPESLLSTTMNT